MNGWLVFGTVAHAKPSLSGSGAYPSDWWRSVGKGVRELRIWEGRGYRLYYGRKGKTVIILLCGGDKSSQTRDIERVMTYWSDCND